jgi:hypothetical protein
MPGIASTTRPSSPSLIDVAVAGNFVYLISEHTAVFVDVSDPAAPEPMGTDTMEYDTPSVVVAAAHGRTYVYQDLHGIWVFSSTALTSQVCGNAGWLYP